MGVLSHAYENTRLRGDVEVVWTAVRGIGDALAFADAKLRGNKPLVMEAKELGNGISGGCKNMEAEK